MIQEAYCCKEIYKLLREKGFEGEIHTFYDKDGYTVPVITHQMAIKWLREKYDLHIIVYPYNANGEKKWCCQVYKTFNLLGYEKYVDETLDSYEHAVEAALKYTLENLI